MQKSYVDYTDDLSKQMERSILVLVVSLSLSLFFCLAGLFELRLKDTTQTPIVVEQVVETTVAEPEIVETTEITDIIEITETTCIETTVEYTNDTVPGETEIIFLE